MQKGNKKPEKCTMYGKLINRLKQGCKNVTKSARSLRTSSQSNSSEANSESGSPPLQKDKLSVSSSNLYHNYALGLIDTDSSPENIRDLSPSTSKPKIQYLIACNIRDILFLLYNFKQNEHELTYFNSEHFQKQKIRET